MVNCRKLFDTKLELEEEINILNCENQTIQSNTNQLKSEKDEYNENKIK